MVGVPVQVPSAAVRTSPSRGVPEMEGGVVLNGAIAPTPPLGSDVAVALPATFVAVTAKRMVPPTSAGVCV